MSLPDRADVAVIGGGPAGLAAALGACRRGLRVALVSSENRVSHWGETLPATANTLLVQLGIIDERRSASHLRSYAHSATWGDESRRGRSALYNPYGPGLILERTQFVHALRKKFQSERGVVIEAKPQRVQRTADGLTISLRDSSRIKVLQARAVVDATGCVAWVSRRLGAVRSTWIRQIARGACYETPRECGLPAETLIEATEQGWLYAAPLPGSATRRAVVWWITDSPLTREPRPERTSVTCQVQRSIEVSRWFREWQLSEVRATSRNASIGGIDNPVGDGWIAVGDAALTLDPLSSSGIMLALLSGLHGGAAVAASLCGDSSGLTTYAQMISQAKQTHLDQRQRMLHMEKRFAGAGFWNELHGD